MSKENDHILVRKTEQKDLSTIAKLNIFEIDLKHSILYPDLVKFDDNFEKELAYLNKILAKEEYRSWVALEKSSVVGYALIKEEKDSISIESIATQKNRRGTGIGSKLLEKITEHATKRKIGRIYLEVYEKNTEALSFYDFNGFVPIKKTLVKSIDNDKNR